MKHNTMMPPCTHFFAVLLILGMPGVALAQGLVQVPSTAAFVDTPEAFVAAVSNPGIKVVLVNKCPGLVVPRSLWPPSAPVTVNRSILIAPTPGLACRPRIDWQYSAGVLLLGSNMTITLMGLEAYKMEAGIPWGIRADLQGPPSRVILLNSWLHNEVSPPAEAVNLFFSTIDRPPSVTGQQQFAPRPPLCTNDDQCLAFTADMQDVAMQVPVTTSGLGGFILQFKHSLLMADTLMSPQCLATKTLPQCLVEALHARNGIHDAAPSPEPAPASDASAHHLLKWLIPVILGSAGLLARCCWLARYSPHELSGLMTISPPKSMWADWGLDLPHPGTTKWAGGAAGGGLLAAKRSLSLLLTPTPGGIRLGCLLGAGSFGRVYEGQWQGRKVAVKVVLHSGSDAQRTAAELEVCSRLSHPHIVTTLFHAHTRMGLASFTRKQARHGGKAQKEQEVHAATASSSSAYLGVPLHKGMVAGSDTDASSLQSSYLQVHCDTTTTTGTGTHGSSTGSGSFSPTTVQEVCLEAGHAVAAEQACLPACAAPTPASTVWEAAASVPASSPPASLAGAPSAPLVIIPELEGEGQEEQEEEDAQEANKGISAAADSVAVVVLCAPSTIKPSAPGVTKDATTTAQHASPVELPAHVEEATRGNETWICMELCDAGSLAQAVQAGLCQLPEGGTDVPLLLSLAGQVAEGMAYLHKQNIIHGDLKCENVLLSHGIAGVSASLPPAPTRVPVTAKVADFGLSRLLGGGRTHVSTRAFGTVSHCPPELLVKGELRPAGDVYAFGIMLYEMGSRVRAYQGMHRGGIVHQVVMEQCRPVLPSDHDLPEQFVALMQECWAQEPQDRPTMVEVLDAIKAMLLPVAPA